MNHISLKPCTKNRYSNSTKITVNVTEMESSPFQSQLNLKTTANRSCQKQTELLDFFEGTSEPRQLRSKQLTNNFTVLRTCYNSRLENPGVEWRDGDPTRLCNCYLLNKRMTLSVAKENYSSPFRNFEWFVVKKQVASFKKEDLLIEV